MTRRHDPRADSDTGGGTGPDLERERFTALYDRHHGRVWAYVVSRAGRQVAEDVVSETFLVAWRRFSELPNSALPWLLGIARNILRERYRYATRRDALAAELRTWSTREALAVADVAEAVTQRVVVLRALADMSESDRELLTLLAWHGLTTTEAAHVVGCSRAAFFVRLHRARRRLQRAMDEQDRSESAHSARREPPHRGSQLASPKGVTHEEHA